MDNLLMKLSSDNEFYIIPPITLTAPRFPIFDDFDNTEEPDEISLSTDLNNDFYVKKKFTLTTPLIYTEYFGSTDPNKALTKLQINGIKTFDSESGRRVYLYGKITFKDITPLV